MSPSIKEFQPRFIPATLLVELSELWHLSRVPHNSRHSRLLWAAGAFEKRHSEFSLTAIYKDLADMVEDY